MFIYARPPVISFALLTLSLGGTGALAQGDTASLIPRDVLFGNPDRANPKLSPDGQWISYLAAQDGVLNVWVAPADNLKNARLITHDAKRGIRNYSWCFDNDHLLYMQDQGGDENWKVYSVRVQDGTATDLTPFEDIKGPDGKPITLPNGRVLRPAAQITALSDRSPGRAIIAINNRNPEYHDLYSVDVATGTLTLLKQNDEYAGFTLDEDFKIRLAAKQNEAGGTDWFVAEGDTFKPWQSVGMEDSLATNPIGFDATGKFLYMTDSRGRNTAALTRIDLSTGKSEVIADDAGADVGDVLVDPKQKIVQGVSFERERTKWRILDETILPDIEFLKTVCDGEINVADRSQDDSRWLVVYTMDNAPARVYLYDRKAKGADRAKFLFTNRSRLEGRPLAHMHPVVIKSRDGLDLVSYLTLPLGTDAKTPGRPASPLPMVLFVHGGPWARDNWGYNPYHQWLANRGYAVLSVNFRGSTGFGKQFLNAGNREWAGTMHNDLLDAVDWAVTNNIAIKDKIAIMGGSYGGYATLVGLSFTPDVFACGVDIVGPSNIVTLLNTIPPYWAPLIEQFTQRVGDFRSDEGRKFLMERSPISRADKIVRPLLIGQGANDPRVNQAESDQIVSAMQQKHIPVTYVLFPDEGHGFARPPNSMAFNAITENFLASHLGGRAQPIGDDVRNSSAEVRAGADGVPGLGKPTPAK